MLENAPEILTALSNMAVFLEELGIPGLIALLLLGPVMTVIAVFILDFLRQRHVRQEDEARRQEAKADREMIRELMERYREHTSALVEQHREQTTVLIEGHRTETAAILRDLSGKHAEVTQFYKDNVELVKVTQHLATDMRDMILNNTRAVERLGNAIEANFYCPLSREAATGKK
jgi:hypothetical protein